jgi:tetratricopeptide (TPR) repeat protein
MAISAFCLLFALSGCARFQAARPPGSLELSREDLAFADALAHYSRGLIYEGEQGKGNPDALRHFVEAARLDPEHHALYARVAMAYILKKMPDEAIAVLKQSCAAQPGSLEAQVDLATAYQISGRTADAIDAYRRALLLDDSKSALYLAMASLHFHAEDDPAALKILGKAIRKTAAPAAVRAYAYSHALQFVQRGEPERAIACLGFAAEHADSDRAKIYHLIGELHESLEADKKAQAYYLLATREKECIPQSFVKLALLQLSSDPERAIETLLGGHRRKPESVLILLALGQVYSHAGRHEEAVGRFEEVSKLLDGAEGAHPTAGFFLQYGAACERAGMDERAARIFEEGLKEFPDAHQVLNYLAYMWAENNENLDQALKYVKRALEHESDNGAYLDTLGWIYYRQKAYQDALIHIQKAKSAMGEDPTIADHLGDIYEALGRRDRAVTYWKESFRLDAGNRQVAEKLRAAGIDPDKLPVKDEEEPTEPSD